MQCVRSLFLVALTATIALCQADPRKVEIRPGRDGLMKLWIPAGEFRMGCSPGDPYCKDEERPAHSVTISKGFWIDQVPVTVGAYRRFVAASQDRRMSVQTEYEAWKLNRIP